MKSRYVWLLWAVPWLTACDPEQTVTFKVDNQTSYVSEMTLYANGVASQRFQIDKSTGEVIFSESGLSPGSFQPHDFDSIRFNFEHTKWRVFKKDTVNSPNDIYDGENWKEDDRKHTQVFTYTLNNEAIQ
jgi:hypothetical protein